MPTVMEDVDSLTTILSQKQKALDDAYIEIDHLQDKVTELRKETRTISERSSVLESNALKSQIQISSLDAENQQQKKTIEFLNKVIQEKDSEFQNYRKENSSQLSQLQNELSTTVSEKSSLEKRVAVYEDRLKQFTESSTEAQISLSENERKYHTMQLQFRKEMDSMKELCTLHQRDAEEATLRREEAEKLYAEVRNSTLSQISDLEEQVVYYTNEVEIWKNKYDDLLVQENGDNINDSSQFNTSRTGLKGLSYTQLYTQFEEERSQRISYEREFAIINDKLETAILELQSKAPYIRDLEYSNKELSSKNESLLIQLAEEVEKREYESRRAEDIISSVEQIESERDQLKTDSRDLAYQVVVLARQLHRGDIEASLQSYIARFEDSDTTDVDQAISKRLVEIKSLEELVQQNVSLRRLARKLAKELESKNVVLPTENKIEDGKVISQLKDKVSSLEKQVELSNKQRVDMQKALENKIPIYERMRTPSKGISGNYSRSSSPYRDTKVAGDEYIELKQEYVTLRDETEQTIEGLSTDVEQLRKAKLDLSIKVSELETRIKYEQEKCRTAEDSSKKQRIDLSELRDKLVLLSNLQATHEAKIRDLTESFLQEKTKADNRLNEINQLKMEKELFVSNKQRFIEDIKTLTTERNSANDRSEKLQQKLEDVETFYRNERKRLSERLDTTETELSASRRKLQTVIEEQFSTVSSRDADIRVYESRVNKLTLDLDKTNLELDHLKSDYTASKKTVESLTKEKDELQTRINDLESKLESAAEGTPEAQIRDLEKSLRESRKQFALALQDIEAAKVRENNFKELANKNEERFNEFNQTYEVYKNDREKFIIELKQQLESLEIEKTDLSSQLESSLKDLEDNKILLSKFKAEHEDSIVRLENELSTLKTKNNQLTDIFDKLKAEADNARAEANTAQSKYENEVVAHSNTLSSLQKIRDSEGSSTELINRAEERASSAEEKLIQNEKSHSHIKSELENTIKEQDLRIADLSQQNSILHSQFTRMQEMHKNNESSSSASDILDPDSSLKELEELVKLMRSEKELLKSKLNVSLAENERLKIETSHLEASLTSLKKKWDGESLRMNQQRDFESKEKQLVESNEQATLLRESNVVLRGQVNQSTKRIKELEGQLSDIQNELGPLKEEKNSLFAEINIRKEENESLIEDNKRWRERVDNILKKYQRIDPQEYEELKNSNALLKEQKESLSKECSEIKEELASLKTQWKTVSDSATNDKLILNNNIAKVRELSEALAVKEREITELKELVNDPEKNEHIRNIKAEADKKRSELIQQANLTLGKYKERNKALLDEVKSLRDNEVNLENQINALREEVNSIKNSAVNNMDTSNNELSNEITELKQSLLNVQQEKEAAIIKIKELENKSEKNVLLQVNSLNLKNKLLSDQLSKEKNKTLELTQKLLLMQKAKVTQSFSNNLTSQLEHTNSANVRIGTPVTIAYPQVVAPTLPMASTPIILSTPAPTQPIIEKPTVNTITPIVESAPTNAPILDNNSDSADKLVSFDTPVEPEIKPIVDNNEEKVENVQDQQQQEQVEENIDNSESQKEVLQLEELINTESNEESALPESSLKRTREEITNDASVEELEKDKLQEPALKKEA